MTDGCRTTFSHPEGWKPARGYSNGVAASGRMLFLGGMIGWNAEQEFESDDFIEQVGAGAAQHRGLCWPRAGPGPSTSCG